jgi:hypothetical protein
MAFFSSPLTAFPLLPDLGSVDAVGVWGSFPNGSSFTFYAPATQATITLGTAGTSGNWEGTGVSWEENSDRKYVITFGAPEIGVVGTLSLEAVGVSSPIPVNIPVTTGLSSHLS